LVTLAKAIDKQLFKKKHIRNRAKKIIPEEGMIAAENRWLKLIKKRKPTQE
jgi:hypothetical protein